MIVLLFEKRRVGNVASIVGKADSIKVDTISTRHVESYVKQTLF